MVEMHADASVLSREAGNFERIASELRAVIAQVESTASALAGQWRGQAAQSAQAALLRFHEAASAQVRQPDDISGNVYAAGLQYTSTDEEQAQSLATKMGASMGNAADASSSNGVAAQSGSLQSSLANAAADQRVLGTRLVSNIKQDGGPPPPPPVPAPGNQQPQVGPFPVPPQVAAAAARPGAPKVPADPAAMLAPLDVPDSPSPPLNFPKTPPPPPSPAGAVTPKCSVYDATKAVLEPAAGIVGILTAAPEAATGLGVPIALAQIAGSTAMAADGLDAAEKCLG